MWRSSAARAGEDAAARSNAVGIVATAHAPLRIRRRQRCAEARGAGTREQGHFRTICTRVQFAAGQGFGSECPKGSVYGHVKVWTPLLDKPLSGPVYLRSSNHNLPDAVFALHGLVDIEVAVRIDSTHGRLRATVADAPDAPVSRAVVRMGGGQKGLFVNSADLCPAKHRARVNAKGQNGRKALLKPLMRAVKCGKAKRKKSHKRHHTKRGRQR